MRFLVECRSTTDRKGIVKDDSLDRNVGSGQIVEKNIIIDNGNDINNSNSNSYIVIVNSDNNGRSIEKIIINDNVIFKDDRIIIEGDKTCYSFYGIIKGIRENERAIEYDNNIEEIDYEDFVGDVARKEIRDILECTSSIHSTSFFDYMRILSASLSSH